MMNKRVEHSGLKMRRDERGMALLAVLMVVFLLTLLGVTSMQLAGQEIVGASALQEERLAHHAAEAAIDVVMGWFHDPALIPQGIEPAWLAKRMTNPQSVGHCFRKHSDSYRDAGYVCVRGGNGPGFDCAIGDRGRCHKCLGLRG